MTKSAYRLIMLVTVTLSGLSATTRAQTVDILQPTRDRMPLIGTKVMLQDSEGYIWYGTVEGGLCRDNGYQIDVFRNDRHSTHRIGQSNGILSLCEDSNGNIVFGTRKNIFVLRKSDYSIHRLDRSIPDGRVTALGCGTDGVITAVTENGTFCFDRAYKRVHGRRDNTGLPDKTADTCRLTDRYGNIWTGGPNMENRIRIKGNGGVKRLKPMELPAMLTNVRPDFVAVDDGFLGHTNDRVFHTQTIEAAPAVWHEVLSVGTRISCAAVDTGGWLFVGDEKGLYKVRYESGKTQGRVELIADTLGNIRKMTAAPAGGVYFITPHCELAYCDRRGRVTVIQRGTESKALAVAPDGTVWTTNWFGDVFRYDRRSSRLVAVEEAGIETGDPVNAMTCDSHGNLWLITDKMLKEYTTDGRWRTMACSDMRMNVCQFCDIGHNEGRIIVRCADAVLSIDPDYRSPIPHRLALTTVSIDGMTRYDVTGDTVTIPSDATVTELYFSTFNHVGADNVRYAYRVNGGEWHQLDAGDNHITFVNLQKGRYDIEVRASDDDGFWGRERLHVCLDRRPAWWETWWASLLYVLMAGTLVVLADRFWQRYKAAKRKITELQARLDGYLTRDDSVIENVAEQITDNNADREFIDRAIALVEKNMGNSDFDIDTFCTEMGVSRSSLYRKFADITGQKPTEFVRSIRLKRSAELIRQGGLPVSEIAYRCGFSSPSYFNRRFKEMFGVPPSEYR